MKHLYIFTAALMLSVFTAAPVYSQVMSNPSYKLELDTNPPVQAVPEGKPGVQNETQKTLNAPRLQTGDNYTVYASYDTDNKTTPLLFSIGSEALNFGIIKPGEPIIRSHAIRVLPGSSQGYSVLASQSHVLNSGEAEIPNTSCDTGSCTHILSDSWSIPLTYGFGYRCDNIEGSFCDSEFNKGYYKRFANERSNEAPATVMSSFSQENSEGIISYKINVPGTQEQKGYQTTIYYIAVPNL